MIPEPECRCRVSSTHQAERSDDLVAVPLRIGRLHVQQVAHHRPAAAARLPLVIVEGGAVLVDEPLRPLVALPGQPHRPPSGAADVQHAEHRQEVLQVGRAVHREVLAHHLPEPGGLLRIRLRHVPLAAIVPLPGDHPRHHVQRQLERPRLHVGTRGARLRRPVGSLKEEAARGEAHLVAADGGGAEEAARGEHLDGGDAAEVAPVSAVAGGPQRGVAVGEVARGGEPGPVGEDDVVGRQALLGGCRVGDVEHAAGAEAEEQHRPVRRGEVGQRAVERLLEEVQVADDRQGWWARR